MIQKPQWWAQEIRVEPKLVWVRKWIQQTILLYVVCQCLAGDVADDGFVWDCWKFWVGVLSWDDLVGEVTMWYSTIISWINPNLKHPQLSKEKCPICYEIEIKFPEVISVCVLWKPLSCCVKRIFHFNSPCSIIIVDSHSREEASLAWVNIVIVPSEPCWFRFSICELGIAKQIWRWEAHQQRASCKFSTLLFLPFAFIGIKSI